MNNSEELTLSEKKTKNTIYKIIGRKISESRKSSRRKFEGISKKLNISVDILKNIESGEIENIEKQIPVTGFIRAYAKITNTDISEELDKLQSNYIVSEKPKRIYSQVPSIKASKIFVVFLLSFSFLLLVIYFLNSNKQNNSEIKLEDNTFSEEDFFNEDDYSVDKSKLSSELKLETNNYSKQVEEGKNFFEIIFLEETWIEIYKNDKTPIKSGLFNIGDRLDFQFETVESDFFIKSGNLGGFQIFFKDEFFAPFGYSGEVNKGFYLKEKIKKIKSMRL